MNHPLQRLTPHLTLFLAILVCIGAYWTGLRGPLLLDDISNLGNIFAPTFGADDILINLFSNSGILGRPVSMLSFIINGLLGHDLFYWKLANLLIHLCCGILIFLLIARLFRLTNSGSKLMAAIIAAAWLLHPIQVSTVLYTVQRMTELSALFVFAAMLTYTIARERQRAGLTTWPLQIATWFLLFPLAILSKENALLLPAFILLLEVFLLKPDFFTNRRLTIAILPILFFVLTALLTKGDWIFDRYEARGFTLQERLYTESRIIIVYLGMLLIPAQRRMGFAHDGFTISHGLIDPWTTLTSILIITILIVTSFLLRKKHPLIGLGIIFFFVGHSMESTILPLELMYEHRNYLPSFGIILATATTLNTIVKRRTIIGLFSVASFSLLIYTTHIRADTWSSTQSLYYYMEMVHPESERLAAIKATQYANAKQYALAHKRLENFNSLGAHLHNLNIECLKNGRLHHEQLDTGLAQYTLADNYAIMQLVDLANLGLDSKCVFSPESFLYLTNQVTTSMKSTRSNRQIVLMYRAHYLWNTNREEEALDTLHKTFTINQKNPTPLFLACEWMLDINDQEKADNTCKTALNVADNTMFGKYDDLANKVRARLKSSTRSSIKGDHTFTQN